LYPIIEKNYSLKRSHFYSVVDPHSFFEDPEFQIQPKILMQIRIGALTELRQPMNIKFTFFLLLREISSVLYIILLYNAHNLFHSHIFVFFQRDSKYKARNILLTKIRMFSLGQQNFAKFCLK
jgi:hypothetical protein